VEATEICPRSPRSGIRRKKGALIAQIAATLAAGGTVWCGDETTVREFPPLRAAWARRGTQQVVVISGRNARRVLHGALNIVTGELVHVVRERGRGADSAALVEVLVAHCPVGAPHLLIWDNAPPHHTHAARDAATAAGMVIGWLPFRSPELNPCEDVWREMKRVVAANRAYADVDEQATRAVAWLDDRSGEENLHTSGLQSSKFDWLPT
jgi:transposase